MHACTHINEYDCNRLSAEESYKDLEICIQQQVLDQNEVMMALNTKLKESRKAGDTLNQKVNFTTFTRLLYMYFSLILLFLCGNTCISYSVVIAHSGPSKFWLTLCHSICCMCITYTIVCVCTCV